ncbi:hypothetical protein ARMGADRAFT_1011006 [Armillaria gallica]|uniref:Uncharacterized protein n=1 Tax=Armillaria gallica TaxID=47427 RepID=A0A2H3DIQ3_ARMGA|nr:hypothetical protein ARMGADRAFT_1011006 [Armillaria gallica]
MAQCRAMSLSSDCHNCILGTLSKSPPLNNDRSTGSSESALPYSIATYENDLGQICEIC